jgi:hypothetical protein
MQQGAFAEDLISGFTMLWHVNEIEESVAARVMAGEVDAAMATKVAQDCQHELVAIPVHTTDAGLLEGRW